MNIGQVMQSTATEYRATYTWFDQSGLTLSGINKSGVCFAVCKAWLRSLDKVASHKFFAFCESEPNRFQIERKEDRHSRKPDRKQDRPSSFKPKPDTRLGEKHLFADSSDTKSLPLYKVLNKTEQEFWTDAVGKMSRLYRVDLMVINGKAFWADVSERLCYTTRKNLIILQLQNQESNHAVASCAQGEKSYFFDPNGGILAFEDAANLKKWLMEKFTAAEEYNHKIQGVEVYNYRHGIKDPWRYAV